MKLRPLHKIAAEILTLWYELPPPHSVRVHAMPYIQAMLDLTTCKDMYGLEYGDMIVARALNNMTHWRGPSARRIKIELKDHMKEYNDAKHNS